MNYEVNSENLFVKDLIFDDCQEVPIDLDFGLPDYCPDIQRILKCIIKPKISSRNILGDRLNIDGNMQIKVMYIDSEKKSLRCFEKFMPFSCSIDLKISPENAVVLTSEKVEYINCRAVSPRKIDIHGATVICVKIFSKDKQSVTFGIDGEDIQQKKQEVLVSDLEALVQQQFSINETLDFGQNKPVPEIIIRSDVSLVMDEYRSMSGKVMVKGQAIVKILYMCDISSGQIEVMEYSIPFNQVVDVPGITEKSKCVVNLEVLSSEEQIEENSQENSGLVSEEIKAALAVMSYGEKNLEIVEDVYSTEHDLKYASENTEFCKFSNFIKDSFSVNSMIEFTEFKISRIIDIWGDTHSIKGTYENGKILFSGKINVCILAIDLDETPFYIERIVDIKYQKDLGFTSSEILVESEIYSSSIGYRITGSGSIEVKLDLNLSAYIYECSKFKMITSVSADEENPKEKDLTAALTIYYADSGESVWDIAKKHYTSVSAVKEENELTSDILEKGRMLLIPMS